MPRSRVEKRPRAIQDLADIAVYLAEESGTDELALRFIDAAESSFEELAAMPAMGAARQYTDAALAIVRMWRVSGFPNHLIFDRPLGSGIEVIRVPPCETGHTGPVRGPGLTRGHAELRPNLVQAGACRCTNSSPRNRANSSPDGITAEAPDGNYKWTDLIRNPDAGSRHIKCTAA